MTLRFGIFSVNLAKVHTHCGEGEVEESVLGAEWRLGMAGVWRLESAKAERRVEGNKCTALAR